MAAQVHVIGGDGGGVGSDGAALTPAAQRSARLGLFLATVCALSAALAGIGFAARIPLTPAPIAVALIALGAWCWRDDRAGAPRLLASAAVVLGVSVALAVVIVDLSFDGQTYHQEAIRLLAGGWNPVWNPARSESAIAAAYVTGLPKGSWILSAMLMQTSGGIEAGKAPHLVLLAASYLLAWPALTLLGVGARRARFVAALAALNPITVPQLFTYYVDGLVASTLVVVLALGLLWIRTNDIRWGLAAAVQAAWFATLKFPAAALSAEAGVLLLAWVFWRDRARLAPASRLAALAVVLALAQAINPYVTNTVRHGHPAYPAAGREAMAIAPMVHHDSTFREQARPLQLARSLFSASSDDSWATPQWKVPFAINMNEVAAFTTVDTRIGGWGPWFGFAVLLGWAALVWGWRKRDALAAPLTFASLAALASALVLPFGFYARYTPQVWLAALPPLLLSRPRWLLTAAGIVLSANLVLVAGVSGVASALDQALYRQQMSALARDAGDGAVTVAQREAPFANVDLHFNAYGIRWTASDTLACDRPAILLRTHAWVCLPGGRSPQPTPDPLDLVREHVPDWVPMPTTKGAR